MRAARRARVRLAGLVAVAAAAVPGAAAAIPAGIPNTDPAGPTDLLAGPPELLRLLGEPEAQAGLLPASVLGPATSPEDDLASALGDLAAATTDEEAAAARDRALEVLEGRPIAGSGSGYADRPYAGMPLLNWDLPLRRRTVAAPQGSPEIPSVTVRIVRFGEHVLSDTWLLDFQQPSQPWRITYEITSLDDSEASLTPTPLLSATGETSGAAEGGLHSAAAGIGVGERDTGTRSDSRFTCIRGLPPVRPGTPGCDPGATPAPTGGAGEHTRSAVQRITVDMPPAGRTAALLEPVLREGHEALATLRPLQADRLAAAVAAMGFSQQTFDAAARDAAIRRLAPQAPESQVWEAVHALVGQEGAPSFLADAQAAGAQAAPLVGSMRRRGGLPPGVVPEPGADVTVVIMNNETYVSARRLRMDPGDAVQVAVRNLDAFARDVEVLDLHDRAVRFGPLDWGEFDWDRRVAPGPATRLASGQTRTFTVTPDEQSFGLWAGDPDGGDQAAAFVALERGPRIESVRFAGSFATPLHGALDSGGNVWVTLAGVDKIARVTPGTPFAGSQVEEFLIPGGDFGDGGIAPPEPAFGPQDIAVDAHGIVWATLAVGNGIARIDPAAVQAGTADGITVIPLNPCPDDGVTCRPPPPPALPGPASRLPLQMTTWEDPEGNTVIAVTENLADSIGILRVDPQGTLLNRIDIPCGQGCAGPTGIGADAQGQVWFVEAISNRVGRLRLDQARPYQSSTASTVHMPIPSATTVVDPEISLVPIQTAGAHSLAVGRDGRVWFTEAETSKVGIVDPAAVQPGTSAGISEIPLPQNDFCGVPQPADITVDRAGVAFVADEYGDGIQTLTASGPGVRWIPPERNSLTDEPVVDPQGNLFYLEAGAGLLSRVRGASAGNPLPGPTPTVTADTTDGTVSGAGLRGADSVDVEIVRGGVIVSRRKAEPVTGGAFTVTDAEWEQSDPSADPLGPGDLVRVDPKGAMPTWPVAFTVARLESSAEAGPEISGTATRAGAPTGAVTVTLAGGATVTVAVDPFTGAFTSQPAPPLAAAPQRVSWAQGTPAAIVVTRTGVGPSPVPGPAVAPGLSALPPQVVAPVTPPPPSAAPGRVCPATTAPPPPAPPPPASPPPAPPPPAPAPAPAPAPPPAEAQSSPPAAPPPPRVPAPGPCPDPAAVLGGGRSGRVPFVGLAPGAMTACLGPPRSRSRSAVLFGGGVRVTLVRGRVASARLTGAALGRGGLASRLGLLPAPRVAASRRSATRRLTGGGGRAVVTWRLVRGRVVSVTVAGGGR